MLSISVPSLQVYHDPRTKQVFGDVTADDFRDTYPRYPDIQVETTGNNLQESPSESVGW